MIRYVNKQRESNTCTPIALVNALKWAGYKISWRDKKELLKDICATNNDGTTRDEFKLALEAIRETFQKCHISRLYKNPSMKVIKNQLAKNRAVIISFCYLTNKEGYWADRKKDKICLISGHSFLLEGLASNGKKVYTRNFSSKSKAISFKSLKYRLTHHKLHETFDPYHVWFITKKG